jgi:hypothetical protein
VECYVCVFILLYISCFCPNGAIFRKSNMEHSAVTELRYSRLVPFRLRCKGNGLWSQERSYGRRFDV